MVSSPIFTLHLLVSSADNLLQTFYFSLYTARPSFEYYRQVHFVHSGLQDESLYTSNHIEIIVWFFNLHKGWISLHRGHPVNVPIRRTMHLSSVIPANNTKESVFGHRNFPRCERGSNLGPLAPEASAWPLSYHAFLKPFGPRLGQTKYQTNCLTLQWYSWKSFLKKSSLKKNRRQKLWTFSSMQGQP